MKPLIASIAILMLEADKATGSAVAEKPKKLSKDEADKLLADLEFPILETTFMPIKALVLDAGTQPRLTLDNDVIAGYTEICRAADKAAQPSPFPPVDAFRDETGVIVLADGFHRTFAHKNGGWKDIQVRIRKGGVREAKLFSSGANSDHGLPRTDADKKRSVAILLDDLTWSACSDSAIAGRAHVSSSFVRSLRSVSKAPAVRVTANGKKMDTTNIGKGKLSADAKKAAKEKKANDAKAAKIAKASAKAAAKAGKPAKVDPAKAAKEAERVEKARLASEAAHADKLRAHTVRITGAIGRILGAAEEKKITDALATDALKLTSADLANWSEASPEKIAKLYPLIVVNGWKPAKAKKFLDEEIDDSSKICDLVNHAIARGGKFSFKLGEFTITVEKK